MIQIMVGMALASAILGASVFAWMLATTEPVVESGVTRSVDDLSVTVLDSTFLVHDHEAHEHGDEEEADSAAIAEATEQAQVFPMPATMMPGMPEEGTNRLQFEVMVENAGLTATDISPSNFYLLSEAGTSWTPLMGGTLRDDTLEPHQILSTIVAFDVPELESEDVAIYLVWRRNDEETRFAVDAHLNHDHEE